jgi:CRP/FNR family transcriptional activator FtrB
MRPDEWSIIRALPLFNEMSEEHFGALMNAAFLQKFPARVNLIAEGELPDFLHIVVEGPVELYANHDGHETTLDIIGPVTTFILAAVIRDAPYLKSARTLSPAQILMVPAATVREVFDRDAAFARAIVDELAQRYRGIVKALKNEKLRTSAQRLANWILSADVKQGRRRQVDLQYDKRIIASNLGMSPENLSRNLALLADHGIRSSARDIFIEDRSALERFAKPNPLIDG